MPEAPLLVEVGHDGRLSLPEEASRRLHLLPGTKLEVLAADDPVLVMRRSETAAPASAIAEGELRLQQQSLARIWDDPAEDIYSDDV